MPKRTKLNPDHAQRHNIPTLDNEARGNQLEALLTPAIADQQKYYKYKWALILTTFKKLFSFLNIPCVCRGVVVSCF